VNKINLLLVDDETLFRQGLRAMLCKEEFIKGIYEAGNASEFKEQLATHRIDVILLGVRLRDTNGLELMEVIKKSSHQPKVIAITAFDGVAMIINLLKSGINGIVCKLNGIDEILKAIKTVMRSERYFPESILKIVQSNTHRLDEIPSLLLSFQEKALLKSLASGATTKEIALQLKMTFTTAETYRVRLMKKAGVSNTAGLLAFAFRNGIL
jgi:DNA-binding NarL/FixJ family response regulator